MCAGINGVIATLRLLYENTRT